LAAPPTKPAHRSSASASEERSSASARSDAARRETMKSRLLIMVSGSVLALTACNKHDETTTNAMDTNVAMDNEAAANMAEPGPMTAQGFVNAVAASDKFEIETSGLAKTATQNSDYLGFAETMVGAHSESTAKLKSIVA